MEIDTNSLRAGVLGLRDVDGHRHAVPANAVKGVHETDGGVVVTLWSRAVVIDEDFDTVVDRLGWKRR